MNMSLYNSASVSNFVISSDSSTSDFNSDIETAGFTCKCTLTEQYTRCVEKLNKYEVRRINLIENIKKLRSQQNTSIVPPPIYNHIEKKEPSRFESNKVDYRTYSEVCSIPSISLPETIVPNVSIVTNNQRYIDSIQRQINLNEWRIKKQLKRKQKLNILMINQANYSPVYNNTTITSNDPASEIIDSPINDYVPFPATSTSKRSVKKRISKSTIHTSQFGIYKHTPTYTRDPKLEIKLKIKIRSFRNIVTSSWIRYLLYYKFKLLTHPVYPQMDAHGEENFPSVDSKLNTAIATQRDTSVGKSQQVIYPEWSQLVSSDHFSSYQTSTDRWTKFRTYQWKHSNMNDISFNIPSDLISELTNTPLFIPFRNNRYWKGDIELKFVLNSNKFQLGSLQISYMYCSTLEQSFSTYRNNVYSASQTNHCILNAGSSNEGCLVIPFKYFNPVITTNPVENVDYVQVFIRVLNQLQCTSSTYSFCDLTVFVNLNNAYFTGSIDFTLIRSPQMFHLLRALVKTAEFGLNQLDPDENRDNPPDVSPPSQVMLTNASSWCVGSDSVDNVNVLRLSALGQTPHPNLQHDELTTMSIARIFGLVNTFNWKFSNRTGDLLLNLEAAPMGNVRTYYKSIVNISNREYLLYNLPPVAIMSNLFAYWRGTLELRLDFIATQFHTGSILVAYIPGIKQDITLDQARSSNYVVCSLQERQSYTIRIPYISNSVFWPRKYNKSYKIKNSVEINPPGSIQLFVLNPLIPIDNVYSTVQVNYYIRAGSDFEFAIPIQPNISTPYNLDYKDAKYNELPLLNAKNNQTVFNYICSQAPSMEPMVTLINRPYNSRSISSYEVLRDGKFIDPTGDHTTDLFNLIPQIPGIFNFYLESSLPLKFYIVADKDQVNKQIFSTRYFVLYNELCGSLGVTILFPCKDQESAKKYAKSEQSWSDLAETVITCYGLTADNVSTINITNLTKIFVHKPKVTCSDDFIICEPNINEERIDLSNYMDMTQMLPSTSHGMAVFGEAFSDIKDYCRRYQYYTTINYIAPDPIIVKQAIAIVPLIPQGLVNSVAFRDGTVNHIVNRCKDGFIPIVSSGYRFYRGGLRIRIISENRRNVNLWVQHRPEMLLKHAQIKLVDSDSLSLSDFFNHGYSYSIQNLELNNTLSLEVPWYNKNMLGCSFYPKTISSDNDINSQKLTAFSLGSLVIGLDSTAAELKTPLNLDIFYAIADDFHFNTFQGFPLMLTLDQIPSTVAYPQMGLFNKIISQNSTVNKIDNLVDKADGVVNSINSFISQVPTLIESNFQTTPTGIKNVLSSVFFNFVHVINNPTIKTCAIAMCAIFVKIGLVVSDSIAKFYNLIERLLKSMFNYFRPVNNVEENDIKECKNEEPSTSGTNNVAQPQSDEEISSLCAGVVALFWAGIHTLLNVKYKACDSIADYSKMLLDNISKGCQQGNIIFRFVRNCFSVIEKCYQYVVNKISDRFNKYLRIKVEEETLQEWLDLCDNLLSPLNLHLVQNDVRWREAVYCAARYGHIYLCKQKPGITPRVDVYIRKVYDKIINLRDSLQLDKLFPSLRMEAYGLWIDGAPGIGKSSMVTRLTTDLLKSVNYKGDSNLIFNVTPLDKYWNNCNHQPVIAIDDAFAITTPECVQNQLWTYFTVMSPVPLIPPMAEIKDKKMHYNPEIMITCSNNAFPKVTGLAEEEALYRRRHQLISAELKNPENNVYPFGCNEEQLKNLEHLMFKLAVDVRDPLTQYSKLMTYKELIEILKKDFHNFKERTAFSYEERKRLQFSMMTDEIAKQLPENVKILEYLKNFDKNKKETLVNERYEFGTLNETYKLLDLIQKNKDFTIKAKINFNLDNITEVPTITEFKEKTELEAAQIVNPMSDDNDLGIMTEEENEQYEKQMKEFDDFFEEQRKEKLKLLEVPELDHMETAIDQSMTGKTLTGVEYRSRFSKLAVILNTSYTKYNKLVNNTPLHTRLVNGLRSYNEHITHLHEPINNIHNFYNHNQCVHELIVHSRKVVSFEYLNLQFPVWQVPIKLSIDGKLEYDRWSHSHLNISDTPCFHPNCLVLNSVKWAKFVGEWLSYGLKFSPWIIKNSGSPVIQHNIFKLSNTKYYITRLQLAIVKTVKFGLYDVLYKSAHWLGGILCNMGLFLSGLAALLGLVGAFKMVRPQLVSSGDTTTKNTTHNVRKIIYNSFDVTPQNSTHLEQTLDLVRKRVVKNTVFIKFSDKVMNKCSNMRCIIIKDRYMLVLRHYIEYLDCNTTTNSSVDIVWADSGIMPFNFRDYKIYWCKDSNIGMLKLGLWFSSKKSLLPFICNSDQFIPSSTRNGSILETNIHEHYLYEETISLTSDLTIAPTSYSKALIIRNAYSYKKNYPGLCGSVLFRECMLNPIIGIHVAGSNGKGFSEPICRNQFETLFNTIENKSITESPVVDWRTLDTKQLCVDDRKLYLSGTHNYLGTVDNNISKQEAEVSSIIPSTLHGIFQVKTQPGPLTPKDPRINYEFSPLLSGCEKNCNPTYNFNKEDLDYAERDLSELINANCYPIRASVNALSEYDAINGLDGIQEYKPLVWNTSEGFYLSRFRPKTEHSKKWLFNFNEENKVTSVHPELRKILDQKHNDRLNSIVPLTIHDDCLKDARLPLEKIKVPGKVRVFSISPVDFTIQFRQYFLDFIAAYTRARFSCEHAIGINVHGMEWTELALKFKDKKIITGDYSGFGPTLNSDVVNRAFNIINVWYSKHNCNKEDSHIRNIMKLELINATHLMGNYLYRVNCGLPSGNPATVIMNSLVNSLYLRCAWLSIMRDTSYSSLVDRRNHFKFITYGDDLISSVSEETCNIFNNNSLSKFFSSLNITFTDAAKTGVMVEPYISFSEATFLKHSFNAHPYRPNTYIAKLDEVSVTECANWVRKSPDDKTATYDNCIQGCMLAYGHGEEYFNNYVKVIKDAWFNKYHEEFVVRTWNELDRLFLDENYYFDW